MQLRRAAYQLDLYLAHFIYQVPLICSHQRTINHSLKAGQLLTALQQRIPVNPSSCHIALLLWYIHTHTLAAGAGLPDGACMSLCIFHSTRLQPNSRPPSPLLFTPVCTHQPAYRPVEMLVLSLGSEYSASMHFITPCLFDASARFKEPTPHPSLLCSTFVTLQ